MVTCFCNVSYNSSFSLRSKRASFSRLAFPLLEGLQVFSLFSFFLGVVSEDSAVLPALFRRLVSEGDGIAATSLISDTRRDLGLLLRRLLSGSSSSESKSLLESSYTLTVLLRLLRRALSSLTLVELFRGFGGRGSKISPGVDAGRLALGEEFANDGVIMILAFGCSGDV
jgi:hypothetical protein